MREGLEGEFIDAAAEAVDRLALGRIAALSDVRCGAGRIGRVPPLRLRPPPAPCGLGRRGLGEASVPRTALRRKDPGRALSAARLLHELCPDCDARRLLAVCHLLCGEHDRAFALARQDAAEVAAVQ